MARLQVKVDHVGTLRRARRGQSPDPVTAASLAEMAGADGITCHLRGDRRHIRERDVEILRQTVTTRLTLQMDCNQEMLRLALNLKPNAVTFLPERSDEITTGTGLDLERNRDTLAKAIRLLKDSGITVGLFIEPDVETVKAAHKLDADTVEINTSGFADLSQEIDRFRMYDRIELAAKTAHRLKLVVGAGHGLNYHTVKDIRYIQEIEEYTIGHAIIGRAVMVGMDQAVKEMARILR